MFREPEATEHKSTIKTDPSAPARSTIRRQRTVRYHPHIRDHSSSSRSRTHGRSREADRRSLLAAIHRGDSGIGSTRLNDNDDFDIEIEADIAHAEASQRRRLQSGRALLRDALSYERPGRRMRVPRGTFSADNMAPPRPTVPDTRRYLEARSVSRQGNGNGFVPLPRSDVQSPVSEYMPTPPYTSGDASTGSSPLGSTAPMAATSLTPRFAPAHRLDDTVEISFREFVARQGQGTDTPRGVDRPRSADLDELPPLRRTDRRSVLDSARAVREAALVAVDGLGDRRRSFSPEDDTWETLLTTMTPDDRLPSIHSSFTSATASASSLSSNSASSYGTLATAPSTATETVSNAYPTICDITDSEGYGTEDEHYADGQDLNVEDFRARELSSHSSTHAHASRTSRHLDRAEQHDRQRRILEREEELRQIQANLDRLERQVPQEWWVAAGLERRSLHGRPGRERL